MFCWCSVSLQGSNAVEWHSFSNCSSNLTLLVPQNGWVLANIGKWYCGWHALPGNTQVDTYIANWSSYLSSCTCTPAELCVLCRPKLLRDSHITAHLQLCFVARHISLAALCSLSTQPAKLTLHVHLLLPPRAGRYGFYRVNYSEPLWAALTAAAPQQSTIHSIDLAGVAGWMYACASAAVLALGCHSIGRRSI
jgi:hypothetical protein